jgi:HEAT repeat protein
MEYCGGDMGKSPSIVVFQYFPPVRPLMVRYCFKFDQDHLYDVLLLALRDRNPKVRYAAIQSIRENKCWKAISLASKAIRDRDDKVRLAAVKCLSEFGSPGIIDALSRALHDSNPLIREEAVRTLKKYPKRKHRQEVQRLVCDWNMHVQEAALDTLLAFHCSEDFVPKLLDLALDRRKPSNIQKLAFENIRQAEKIPVSLIARLEQASRNDNSVDLHLEIVNVIAAYPPGREMQTSLLHFLHHISIDVHRAAVQALGDKGTREAIYHLREVVKEGKNPNQLMNKYDARLAELAIKKIASRYA